MLDPKALHAVIAAAAAGLVSGHGLTRAAVYVAKNLPPLPANAGWWPRLFYSLVKGASAVDPR